MSGATREAAPRPARADVEQRARGGADQWAIGAETCCGARNRDGTVCERPAGERNGRCRCRRHRGAKGVGAGKGNRNALRHGVYTAAEKAERKQINEFIRAGWRFVRAWERVK